MTEIEIHGQTYAFPSSWEELTPDQLTRVCGFLLQPWTPALQYVLIRLLLPITPSVFTRLQDFEILALLPLVEFMQKPILPKEFRLFRIGFRGFWLPAKMKIRAVDWVQSEPLLKQWAKTGEEKYLNLLVATLCRPRKIWIVFFGWFRWLNLNWDGDPREKFHSEIAIYRSNKLSHVPQHKKLLVVWWLVQLRWEVYKTNKSIFGGGSGDGDWIECIMELAEKGLFGDLQATFQTNFHLVLKFLSKEKSKIKRKR